MITVFDNLTGWAKWAAIGTVVTVAVASITSVVLYIKGSELAKAQVITLTKELATEKKNGDINQASYELCELTNHNNALEASIQRGRAHVAELRLAADEVRFDQQQEDHQREAESFKNRGLGCPAMDRRYREWLLDNP